MFKKINDFINTKVLQPEAKEGSIGYMFRNKECAVLNTFIIVSIVSGVLKMIVGG